MVVDIAIAIVLLRLHNVGVVRLGDSARRGNLLKAELLNCRSTGVEQTQSLYFGHKRHGKRGS